MLIANVHKAKTDLSQLIAAALAGENVFIAKAGTPVVKLVATNSTQVGGRKPGALKGKIFVPSDFNEESPEINKMFYGG